MISLLSISIAASQIGEVTGDITVVITVSSSLLHNVIELTRAPSSPQWRVSVGLESCLCAPGLTRRCYLVSISDISPLHCNYTLRLMQIVSEL